MARGVAVPAAAVPGTGEVISQSEPAAALPGTPLSATGRRGLKTTGSSFR